MPTKKEKERRRKLIQELRDKGTLPTLSAVEKAALNQDHGITRASKKSGDDPLVRAWNWVWSSETSHPWIQNAVQGLGVFLAGMVFGTPICWIILSSHLADFENPSATQSTDFGREVARRVEDPIGGAIADILRPIRTSFGVPAEGATLLFGVKAAFIVSISIVCIPTAGFLIERIAGRRGQNKDCPPTGRNTGCPSAARTDTDTEVSRYEPVQSSNVGNHACPTCGQTWPGNYCPQCAHTFDSGPADNKDQCAVSLETKDCPHCGVKGMLLMSDGRCPHCKRSLAG